MNPSATRLRAALATIGWSPTVLAREAGVSVRQVQYWLAGEKEPPETLLGWLEHVGGWMRANPPPRHPNAA